MMGDIGKYGIKNSGYSHFLAQGKMMSNLESSVGEDLVSHHQVQATNSLTFTHELPMIMIQHVVYTVISHLRTIQILRQLEV